MPVELQTVAYFCLSFVQYNGWLCSNLTYGPKPKKAGAGFFITRSPKSGLRLNPDLCARLIEIPAPDNLGKWQFFISRVLKSRFKMLVPACLLADRLNRGIGLTYFIPKLELPPEPLGFIGLWDNKLG